MTFHMHVASGTESRVSGSCQYDDIDIRPFAADIEGIAHFRCRSRGESVAIAFAVDGDAGDPVVEIKQDFFIFFDGFPFSFHSHMMNLVFINYELLTVEMPAMIVAVLFLFF